MALVSTCVGVEDFRLSVYHCHAAAAMQLRLLGELDRLWG